MDFEDSWHIKHSFVTKDEMNSAYQQTNKTNKKMITFIAITDNADIETKQDKRFILENISRFTGFSLKQVNNNFYFTSNQLKIGGFNIFHSRSIFGEQ